MSSPLWNLVVFLGLGAALAGLCWPRVGLVPRLRRQRRLDSRARLEDALKHLYHHDFHAQATTLSSIGGALEIPPAAAVALIERMQGRGLVRVSEGRILLTEDGKRYALQVIRAHRLWERYLADETGVDPLDWHAQAERREHTLTPAQADELAARLGDPRFDPHGDPIPTADGIVPEQRPLLLSELERGARARVVHIEDEPQVVYAQLVAGGVYLGMELRIEEKSDRRIVFEADGRAVTLAPLLAANVSIQRLNDAAPVATATETLSRLRPGELCRVTRISPACRGSERRRLMDLGIVAGTTIAFERPGMSGGLSAYRVRGTLIALREEQTAMIGIEPIPTTADQSAQGVTT